jgi:hypothetical protein
MKYSKPALTVAQQIKQLEGRGMGFCNRVRADCVFDRPLPLLILDAVERLGVPIGVHADTVRLNPSG